MNDEVDTLSKRRNRTKEHLKLALIDLIKEKGYHSISVKDIVNKASYNRSTFYVHYQDKIDLAEDLLDSMMTGLWNSVGKPYRPGQKYLHQRLVSHLFISFPTLMSIGTFFELIKYEDTLPGLHTSFPQTILKFIRKNSSLKRSTIFLSTWTILNGTQPMAFTG